MNATCWSAGASRPSAQPDERGARSPGHRQRAMPRSARTSLTVVRSDSWVDSIYDARLRSTPTDVRSPANRISGIHDRHQAVGTARIFRAAARNKGARRRAPTQPSVLTYPGHSHDQRDDFRLHGPVLMITGSRQPGVRSARNWRKTGPLTCGPPTRSGPLASEASGLSWRNRGRRERHAVLCHQGPTSDMA